jgi:hypothetical protein
VGDAVTFNERWFLWYLRLLSGERIGRECPRILGIDERFFTRQPGLCGDVLRSEESQNRRCRAGAQRVLAGRLSQSPRRQRSGGDGVHWIWRPATGVLVKKHFPQARIVTDRFDVIRVVNRHFSPAGRRSIRPARRTADWSLSCDRAGIT